MRLFSRKNKKFPVGTLILIACAGILLYAGSFVFSYDRLFHSTDPRLITDVSRLIPVKVFRVDTPTKEADLIAAIAEAREKKLKVSIGGSHHSQGGHTFYDGALVLDMRDFDEIKSLDVEKKILRVESGATWDDVQRYINPHGLAVKVMQSSNIFTIGGTLSANAHGRDLDRSSVIETVRSFRLLMADGSIRNVSRTENPELFSLVIGGYGLFGVILDVELELTNNEVYEQRAEVMNYTEFPEYFETHIKNDPKVSMMLVRPSIDPDTFLEELVVIRWVQTEQRPENIFTLTEEANVLRDKFFFGLSRKYNWAKELRWKLQKDIEAGVDASRIVSRTNGMRPPLAPLELLDYYSTQDTDIIQEYYIPTENFLPFMEKFKTILRENRMNVLSSTIRYVKANNEALLSYAPNKDAFAIIQMSNIGTSKKAQAEAEAATQQLVDAALENDGTYYLTYQLYPTTEQLNKAYPKAQRFFERKRFYDPTELFMNKFYEKYAPTP